MALPPCPNCRAALVADRLLGGSIDDRAGFGDAALVRTVALSCPGCLAVIELDDAARHWNAREVVAAAGVLRIRDRLERARESGTLEQNVRALFSNPASALLLGTPELFEFVAASLGRELRLRVGAAVGEMTSFGEGFPAPVARLSEWVPASHPAGLSLRLTGVQEGCLRCDAADGAKLLVPIALVDSV